ncbi:MAG: ribonuclease P protein component [Burkholderiaceae bacterium]
MALESLRSSAEFGALLSTRPVAVSGSYALHSSAASVLRLGLIVPKKCIRSAVARNKVKRWSRVLLRQHGLEPQSVLLRVRHKVAMGTPQERHQQWLLLSSLFQRGLQNTRSSAQVSSC